MNIVGTVVFCFIGGFVLRLMLLKEKEINYSQYPTITAAVLGTEDFGFRRWIVEFQDETGREVLGMDDRICYRTFTPKKYHLPQRKTQEKVYYWKYDRNSRYSINGQQVEYYIHFCDETLYELSNKKTKQNRVLGIMFGALFVGVGILILFA